MLLSCTCKRLIGYHLTTEGIHTFHQLVLRTQEAYKHFTAYYLDTGGLQIELAQQEQVGDSSTIGTIGASTANLRHRPGSSMTMHAICLQRCAGGRADAHDRCQYATSEEETHQTSTPCDLLRINI